MTLDEQNSLLTTSITANALSVVATGEDVSLDETTGLQNLTATPTPAGDADDNDILVASLNSTFAARLTALGAGTATGAALSGYTGVAGNTGSNAFTISVDPGAGITDLSFVGSNGAPLNGLDSELDTLDGTSILLYTDTNNNIVLGRAGGPTGAIVFAAYIEETGSPVTGGKIWMVEYQPLKHLNTTSADDSLNLLNKVFHRSHSGREFQPGWGAVGSAVVPDVHDHGRDGRCERPDSRCLDHRHRQESAGSVGKQRCHHQRRHGQ
ncbi:DUF5801 repeats-in-toxin domain-containing protein [Pseudomonas lini]